MTRKAKAAACIILAFTLILVLGCSIVPQGIQSIFKSATPTRTATPTVTATATATPMPPVTFTLCSKQEDCPQAISFYTILGESLDFDTTNDLTIPYNTSLFINQQWQSTDKNLLKENMDHILWFFRVDGQDYFQQSWLELNNFENVVDPSIQYPGYQWGVILDGWKLGETHFIEVGYTIDESLNNGWTEYKTGYKYQVSLQIMPIEIPTATPTATQTATPTSTNTPRPTAIPYTSTPVPTARPACDVNSSIEIDNTTGGWLTLRLSGPAPFRFDLPTGITILDVCSGSYSYEAWGCGGAHDSGTINSNEAHTFYCD